MSCRYSPSVTTAVTKSIYPTQSRSGEEINTGLTISSKIKLTVIHDSEVANMTKVSTVSGQHVTIKSTRRNTQFTSSEQGQTSEVTVTMTLGEFSKPDLEISTSDTIRPGENIHVLIIETVTFQEVIMPYLETALKFKLFFHFP